MIIQVFHDYLSKTDKLQIWLIKHGRKGHIKKNITVQTCFILSPNPQAI